MWVGKECVCGELRGGVWGRKRNVYMENGGAVCVGTKGMCMWRMENGGEVCVGRKGMCMWRMENGGEVCGVGKGMCIWRMEGGVCG